MKLYWVFVGLFVLSVLMFGYGLFVVEPSVTIIGVIMTFLLYLFRRSFLPSVQNHRDSKDLSDE